MRPQPLTAAFDLAPMDRSNIIPFPASARIRALAQTALSVHRGIRGMTLERAVSNRAAELAALGVSRADAMAEIADFEAALLEAVSFLAIRGRIYL